LRRRSARAIVAAVDLLRQIDLYCERTDATLWSEPLNALTNLAFFAAAWYGWRAARRVRAAGGAAWDLDLLAGLAGVVGLGSLAFHTFAQVWAAWADGLAILAFIYAWLARYLRRIAGLGVLGAAAGLAVYYLLDRLAGALLPPPALNGSGQYLAALLSLAALAIHARPRFPAAGRRLLAAAGVFAVSLAFRTADLAACPAFPPGTHFLWHLLNGAVLALAIGALAASAAPPARTAKP
jgi:hypothetical protein